jgi:type II secretory pathway pseudopilin PulG
MPGRFKAALVAALTAALLACSGTALATSTFAATPRSTAAKAHGSRAAKRPTRQQHRRAAAKRAAARRAAAKRAAAKRAAQQRRRAAAARRAAAQRAAAQRAAAQRAAAQRAAQQPRPTVPAPAAPAAKPVVTPVKTKPAPVLQPVTPPVQSQPATSTSTDPDGPRAALATTGGLGTLTHLDGSASTGTDLTYAWELDGKPVGAGVTYDLKPKVGRRHVKLTVTDRQGRTSTDERDLDVAWRGYPWTAQVDRANGNPGDGAFLPKLTQFITPLSAWRAMSCLNNGYSFQPQADGSVILEVHQGDHPGLTGGDRCAISVDEGLNPNVDVNGNGDGLPRFYRVSFKVDAPTTDLAGVFNNVMEWHGKASGPSVLKVATNGAGTTMFVSFASLVNGEWGPQKKIDEHPLRLGEWQDYIVEARWSSDPTVGYVRVYRSGVCVSCGHPSADSEGRLFGATYKTFADGSTENMTFGLQNYRGTADRGIGSTTVPTPVAAGSTTLPIASAALVPRASSAMINGGVIHWTGSTAGALTGVTGLATSVTAGTPLYLREPLPDTKVQYRDVVIGPTLASVAG